MATATLIAHGGGVRRTRDELALLSTPEPTPTWKPVPHSDLVAELIRGLEAQGVTVGRDTYCTLGKDDAKLFGAMDLSIPNLATAEYGMALGLRTANDRSMAIEVVAGARVFICDNMAFGGDRNAVFLRKKHTSRLDLAAAVPPAIEEFLDRAGQFRLDLDKMHDFAIGDGRAKELIHDAFTGDRPVGPLHLMPEVSRLYFADDAQRAKFPERSLWSLSNGFTEAVKGLKVAPQQKVGRSVGRYFGAVLRAGEGGSYAFG